MKRRTSWVLLALATFLVSAAGWGAECKFFRVGYLDGDGPENLAITMDEAGQTFLEFDTVEGNSYSIEATDSLSPPAWTAVWCLTGDGQRAAWLTTARRWSRTFGGSSQDWANSVQQTSDGGYIVAGYSDSFGAGAEDIYLIKTDAQGNELWSRTFGGENSDWGYSVQQTTDGGYIVAGSTKGLGTNDVYLIKTDGNGNEVWSRALGASDFSQDYGHSVQQTSDGGYIVTGQTHVLGVTRPDVYLIKTDADGNEIWNKTFGGSGYDRGISVQQTTDRGYIVGGWLETGVGDLGNEGYLIKTDSKGNAVWSRTFGEEGLGAAQCVRQTSDGGYIVGGRAEAGNGDACLIKTDDQGNEVWTRTFGRSGSAETAYSVQQTSDGGYIVTGGRAEFVYPPPLVPPADAYLVKTDDQGNEVWSRTFDTGGGELAMSVQQTSDGGYILAGYVAEDLAGELVTDVYLIKTDANGNGPTRVTVWGDDFEEHTPLYGAIGGPWTVISGSNDPIPGDPAEYGTWRLWNTQGDPLRDDSPALDAMTGNYAITDSDLDTELLLNEELITPDIDCTNHRQVRLDFNINYRAYTVDADHEQIAEVDIRRSDDGLNWSSWTNLLRWDSTTVADIESGSQHVNLSAIADGKHIQIRFHFYDAKYDYWFAVDDVQVSGFALP